MKPPNSCETRMFDFLSSWIVWVVGLLGTLGYSGVFLLSFFGSLDGVFHAGRNYSAGVRYSGQPGGIWTLAGDGLGNDRRVVGESRALCNFSPGRPTVS